MISSARSETQFPQLRTTVRIAGEAVCEGPGTGHGRMSGSISVTPVLGWGKGKPAFLLAHS